MRDSMAEYIAALGSITAQLEMYKHPPPNVQLKANSADIVEELERSCGIFKQKLSEQACHMAWVSSKIRSFSVVVSHKNVFFCGNVMI